MLSTSIAQTQSRTLDLFTELTSDAEEPSMVPPTIQIESWLSACHSSEWMNVLSKAMPLATSPEPVVLNGEFGTGKSQIAMQVHLQTKNPGLVHLHCGRLAQVLAVPEVVRKWRTTLRRLLAAQTHDWLLFNLDELPLDLQPWVLDLVETLRSTAQGVMLVTSRSPLHQLRENGQLREDLYYAMGGLELVVPPLRERSGDVMPLVNHFARVANSNRPLQFSREAGAMLQAHRWEGNVPEVRNLVMKLQLANERNLIGSSDLACLNQEVRSLDAADLSEMSLEDAETQLILKALARNGGNRTATAKHLGITTRTLHNKMRKYKSMGLITDALP